MNKKHLLIFLFFLLFLINYPFLDKFLINFFDTSQQIQITQVIDGDTIKTGNISIRLLGINAPEKKEPFYQEAKDFLKLLVENKSVVLFFGPKKYDKYKRTLAYVYVNEENINKKLIEQGLANPYFPDGKTEKSQEFQDAWEKCIKKQINLCAKSSEVCASCITIKDFNSANKKLTLKNICSFSCNLTNWIVKGGGRKKVFLNQTITRDKLIQLSLYESDAIYLRDTENKLVLWKIY